MTDKTSGGTPAAEETASGAPAPEGTPWKPYVMPDTPSEEAAPAAPAHAVDVEALVKEAAESRDRVLRTLADMENLRRRTEKDVADARAYGISGFARDMLGIADNFRRALDAIAAEDRAALPPAALAFVEGVELTERELLKALEKNGVRKFDPAGEKFDPNIHQAMFEIPDTAKPSGTVVQVLQSGYMIGERVLRPALVGVAKGGPKAAPTPAAEPAANESGTPDESGRTAGSTAS